MMKTSWKVLLPIGIVIVLALPPPEGLPQHAW